MSFPIVSTILSAEANTGTLRFLPILVLAGCTPTTKILELLEAIEGINLIGTLWVAKNPYFVSSIFAKNIDPGGEFASTESNTMMDALPFLSPILLASFGNAFSEVDGASK